MYEACPRSVLGGHRFVGALPYAVTLSVPELPSALKQWEICGAALVLTDYHVCGQPPWAQDLEGWMLMMSIPTSVVILKEVGSH